MAQVISFFPRQVYAGGEASEGPIYSQVFDVSEYNELKAELRVFLSGKTTAPTGMVSGIIEETTDPTLENWTALGSPMIVTGVDRATSGYTDPLRFVRAKMTVRSGISVTACLEAVARKGT